MYGRGWRLDATSTPCTGTGRQSLMAIAGGVEAVLLLYNIGIAGGTFKPRTGRGSGGGHVEAARASSLAKQA